MMGNSEKMLLISSPASNEWSSHSHSQNKNDEYKAGNLNNNCNNMGTAATVSITGVNVVDQNQKQQQQQQQQQQQEGLRCPRCDSTNTKFCYYNNYSLSQPRHFCKACKRYWTRGGTLRNVPVGGACRKNKRVKTPTSSAFTSSSSSSSSFINNTYSLTNNNTNTNTNTNTSLEEASVNAHNNVHDLGNHHPLFYGLPTNHSPNSNINFPFSRYHLQNPSQINGLGLGFSSGLVHTINNMNLLHHHQSPQNSKQVFHDLISSNPLILHPMKGANSFQTILPSYEDHDLHNIKNVKMEFEGQNRSLDNHWNHTNTQNQIDHDDHQTMVSSSNPSIIWGSSSTPSTNTWLDPSNNLGSTVPSLI